jgi:hypothetical protein
LRQPTRLLTPVLHAVGDASASKSGRADRQARHCGKALIDCAHQILVSDLELRSRVAPSIDASHLGFPRNVEQRADLSLHGIDDCLIRFVNGAWIGNAADVRA